MDNELDPPESPNPICPPPLDESFLDALFNGLTEAVFAVDLETRCIVFWNTGAAEMFGYTAKEALRQTTEFLQPDRASFNRIYEIAVPEIRKKGFWRGEWNYRKRNGTIFPTEITATLIRAESPANENANVVVVIRDITERKEFENEIHRLNRELAARLTDRTTDLISARDELVETEQELHATAEQFRLLVEGVIGYAILMLDFSGSIISWNSGATKIFGYQENEIIGKRLSLLEAHTDNQVGSLDEFLQEAATKGYLDKRTQLIHSSGSTIQAHLLITPFYDTSGQHLSFSVIVRDITEQQVLRQQLQEKQQLATIGTTASMLAHEISNPLNGMFAAIQTFDRQLTDDKFLNKESAKSTVNDLKGEIRHLQSLLDEFKNLARPMVLNLQAVELSSFVREMMSVSMIKNVQQQISFIEDVPQTLPPVNADPDKLKQALLNLIKNAIEAMPTGGTIFIKGVRRDTDVCLEISDTGEGIPENVNIFDSFETTKPGGTGLGLVVVRQIISAFNGSITYSSQPGKGATFAIRLRPANSVKSG